MAASITFGNPAATVGAARATTERTWVRWTLIGIAITFLATFLFLPLAIVFSSALAKGFSIYFAAVREPDAIAAIKLTLSGSKNLCACAGALSRRCDAFCPSARFDTLINPATLTIST